MSAAPVAPSARIRALLERQPVLDGHNDLLWEARERVGYDFDRLDIGAGGTPPTPTCRACAVVASVRSSGRCSSPPP